MESRIKKALFLFILVFASTYGHASLMLEPRVFTTTATFDAGNNDGNLTGKGYGLKIGYLGEYFMAGINLEKQTVETQSGFSTDNYQKFDGGGIGTFMGFHFWDLLKVWTSYLNTTLEPTSNRDYRYFGQYVSFGIGFRVYQGLLISYEGFRNQYTQEENDETGKTRGLDDNIKTEGSNLILSYILKF